MEFKETALKEINQTLMTQAVVFSQAKAAYLRKESERKTFEARLIKAAPGGSHAERMNNAMADEGWREFHVSLARLEAIMEFQKLKFSVLEKEWLAQHQELKLDSGMIKRGVE